jgi:hypothetical protein
MLQEGIRVRLFRGDRYFALTDACAGDSSLRNFLFRDLFLSFAK